MNQENKDGENDAPYNFSLFYYKDLSELLNAKDQAYLQNDINAWYKGLDRIFTKIIFKLTEAEETELSKLFEAGKTKLLRGKEDPAADLHKIDKKLIKLMDKYKMIFPRIDNVKGLDKLNRRYNLKDSDAQ